MFDVSFSEIVVIAVVALVVIGPEKLPKVARMLGALTGRMQRYVSTVKADIEREMQFEDLQKLQDELRQRAMRVENTLQNEVAQPLEAEIYAAQSAIQTSESSLSSSSAETRSDLDPPSSNEVSPQHSSLSSSSDDEKRTP